MDILTAKHGLPVIQHPVLINEAEIQVDLNNPKPLTLDCDIRILKSKMEGYSTTLHIYPCARILKGDKDVFLLRCLYPYDLACMPKDLTAKGCFEFIGMSFNKLRKVYLDLPNLGTNVKYSYILPHPEYNILEEKINREIKRFIDIYTQD